MSDAVRVACVYTVRDFDEFRAEFARTEAKSAEFGILGASVHRSLDNPNEVLVTLEVRSTADALALLSADDRFRAWMDRVGVEAYPWVFVGREAAGLPTVT